MTKRIYMSVVAMLLLLAITATASAATVTRDLPDTSVDPSSEFEVSISQSGFFVVGNVFEVLPEGFTYVSESAAGVDSASYNAGTRTLTLVIDAGTSTVTYRVTAGTTESPFSGTYSTIDGSADPVTGSVVGDTTFSLTDTNGDGGGDGGSDVTVIRDLPDIAVVPGTEFEVSISQSGFFAVGNVFEVLPEGYAYVSGSAAGVDSASYNAGTRTLTLVIDAGTSTVTYRVTAGTTELPFSGTYSTVDTSADPVIGNVGGETTVSLIGIGVVSVTRDLPDMTVDNSTQFDVSLSQSGFFVVGTVVEVLPEGYAYVDGSATGVDSASYNAGTMTLTLVIDAGTSTVTYSVISGTADGTFTGTFSTIDGSANPVIGNVGGEDDVTITTPGPDPSITAPSDQSTIFGTVTVTAINNNVDSTIVYCKFEHAPMADSDNWTELGNDTNGTDGWSVENNTKLYPDGDYYLRATMGDSEGYTGDTQIMVTLANPPEPRITKPVDGANIRRGISIDIIEVDESGQDDIVSNTFEYSLADEDTWTLIGVDYSPDGGWKVSWNIPEDMKEGDYKIRATMEDVKGNTGTDEINMTILTEGIPLFEGWNLFSVPGRLDNASVEHVLEDIIPDTAAVLIYWDASVSPGMWVNVAEIEPLKGYAIFVSNDSTIVNLDPKPEPSGSLQLYKGINYIGMTGYVSAPAETALAIGVGNIDNSYDKIYHCANGTSDRIGYNCNVWPGSPCPPKFDVEDIHVSTEDFQMEPYAGYLVHMTEDAIYYGQAL